MAQINFPVATADGQTFEAPNGVIYTYVGTPPNGYWSGTFQDQSLQTLDGRYLKLDASNDPVTGACDFTGLTTHEAGVDVVNAVINTDGSAEFAGDITFKGWESNTDGGAKIVSGGFIQAKRSSGSALNTAIVWGGGHADGSQPMNTTSQIFADGSATFAGPLGITGKSGTDTAIYVWDAGNANATTVGINANGSATFAGLTEHEGGVSTGTVSNGSASISLAENTSANLSFSSGTVTQGGTQAQGGLFTFNSTGSYTRPVYGFHSYLGIQGFSSTERIGAYYTALSAATNISSDKFVAGYISQVQSDTNQGTGDNYNFYAAGDAPSYFAGRVINKEVVVVSSHTDSNSDILNGSQEGMYFNGVTGGIAICKKDSVGDRNLLQCMRGGGATTRRFIDFRFTEDNSDAIGWIDATASQVAYRQTSDYRLKENIEPLTSASDRVKELKPCSFNFIGQDEVVEGFVAHEIQEVVPATTSGSKDATEAIGTLADYDGTVLEAEVTEPSAEELTYTEEVETDGVATMVTRTRTWSATGTRPVYQGVDQTKLIPLLTKALQEVMQKNEDLEARIAALEG